MALVKHGAKKDSSLCVSTEYLTPEYQYGQKEK